MLRRNGHSTFLAQSTVREKWGKSLQRKGAVSPRTCLFLSKMHLCIWLLSIRQTSRICIHIAQSWPRLYSTCHQQPNAMTQLSALGRSGFFCAIFMLLQEPLPVLLMLLEFLKVYPWTQQELYPCLMPSQIFGPFSSVFSPVTSTGSPAF